MHRTAFLVALLAAGLSLAAPVPKETPAEQQFRKVYGTRVDETKRGTFSSGPNTLTISLSDQPFDTDREPPGAPRVMREVEGDFVAQVSLVCPLPDTVPDQTPLAYLGGGIVVMLGKGHYVHFGRYNAVYQPPFPERPKWRTEFYTHVERPNATSVGIVTAFPEVREKQVCLRLTRWEKTFTAEHSSDGKEWNKIGTITQAAPAKLQLGLFALHNMKGRVDINFWDYSVAPLKD